MHEHTISYYSRYIEGDKVTFRFGDKIVHGTVSAVGCDIVDGHLIPIYAVEDCDTVFSWGSNEYGELYEKEIIED